MVSRAPGAAQTPKIFPAGPKIMHKKPKCERQKGTSTHPPNSLRIDPPGYFSLIYAAIIKPGLLGKLMGPTLAENLPKDEKK